MQQEFDSPTGYQFYLNIVFENLPIMANHKSALKRVRQNKVRRERNRYYAKSTRSAMKDLRSETNKEEAQKKLPEVSSMIDKLAKKNIIHKNKAANLKSSLAVHVNAL